MKCRTMIAIELEIVTDLDGVKEGLEKIGSEEHKNQATKQIETNIRRNLTKYNKLEVFKVNKFTSCLSNK